MLEGRRKYPPDVLEFFVAAGIMTAEQAEAAAALVIPTDPAPPTELWRDIEYDWQTDRGLTFGDVVALAHRSWPAVAAFLNHLGFLTPRRWNEFTPATARYHLRGRVMDRRNEVRSVVDDDEYARLQDLANAEWEHLLDRAPVTW